VALDVYRLGEFECQLCHGKHMTFFHDLNLGHANECQDCGQMAADLIWSMDNKIVLLEDAQKLQEEIEELKRGRK